MVLQAALAVLLSRLGAGTDIPVGHRRWPGRTDEALDDLVGFFVNTLVLRTDLTGDPTFAELLARVRETDLAASRTRTCRSSGWSRSWPPARSLARHPLFQVMLDPAEHRRGRPEPARRRTEPTPTGLATAKFDLDVGVQETFDADGAPAGLSCSVIAAADLFDAGSAELLTQRLVRVLEVLAAEPRTRLSALSVLAADERQRLLAEWSATEVEADSLTEAGHDTRAYVLDEWLAPVPAGVPGELYVGGAQPARGLHGRPGPTAESFVANPFATDGSRLHRTGSQARWTADGRLVITSAAAPGNGGHLPASGEDPAQSHPRRPVRGPANLREELLSAVFAQVLGRERVGVDEDFFQLGGHSLSAIRLLSRVRAVLGVEVSLRTLFEAPTVAGLAARLAESDRARLALTAAQRPDLLPLSFAQRRLWFLGRLEGPSPTYNVPVALRLTGDLDRAALDAALLDVIGRHEVLRTVLPTADGEPYQRILEPAELEWRLEETGDRPRRTGRGAGRGVGPRLRPVVRNTHPRLAVRDRPDEHVLVVVLHHIASDGWSTAPLARDLVGRVRGTPRGPGPGLGAAAGAVRGLRAVAARAPRRRGRPGQPARPAAGLLARGAGRSARGADPARRPAAARRRPATAADWVTSALARRAARARWPSWPAPTARRLSWCSRPALAVLLPELGAGTDIPIGIPDRGPHRRGAGRPGRLLRQHAGAAHRPVRRPDLPRAARPGPGRPTWPRYAHQDVPFERLVEVLNPERSLARHPLFQVMLACRTTPRPAASTCRAVAVEAARPATGRPSSTCTSSWRGVRRDGAPGGRRRRSRVRRPTCSTARRSSRLAERLVRVLDRSSPTRTRRSAAVRRPDDAERQRVLRRVERHGG